MLPSSPHALLISAYIAHPCLSCVVDMCRSADTAYAPYEADEDDRLSQICQVQIFVTLLTALVLRTDRSDSTGKSMDLLLTTLTFTPLAIALITETPLADLFSSENRTNLLSWLKETLGWWICGVKRVAQIVYNPRAHLRKRDGVVKGEPATEGHPPQATPQIAEVLDQTAELPDQAMELPAPASTQTSPDQAVEAVPLVTTNADRKPIL